MTNNKQLQLALEIATMAHKNVQRRNGDPYIFHVLRVANNSTYIRTKTQKAAGILHDVIEDTPFDEEFLRQQGIDDAILEILRFLTHVDVLPGLKPRDSRLLHGKRAQFSSPPHG